MSAEQPKQQETTEPAATKRNFKDRVRGVSASLRSKKVAAALIIPAVGYGMWWGVSSLSAAALWAIGLGVASFVPMGGRALFFNKKFRTGVVFLPAALAVGQCSFVERLPIDSTDSWKYVGGQTASNYRGATVAILDGLNGGMELTTKTWDKTQTVAAKVGIGDGPSNGTTTVTMNIPTHHIAIECRPSITRQDRHDNASKIENLRVHHDSLLTEWKKMTTGLIVNNAAKGDVMVIYPHFNDMVQNPSLKTFPGGSYAPCPTGYNRETYPLHKWVQNKHDAPTRR